MKEQARKLAARIRDAISSYNPDTTYKVECLDTLSDKLVVCVPGGLLPQQRELIRKYRDKLIAFFSTPPETTGVCIRGHTISWLCNQYGVWVCACYTLPYEPANEPEQSNVTAIQSYWKQEKESSTSILPSSFKQKAGIKKMVNVQSCYQQEYSIPASSASEREEM